MSSPQMWTLIGVLTTLMFAMHRLTVREMSARFDAVDAKFVDVDHRLAGVEGDLGIIKASLINQRSA